MLTIKRSDFRPAYKNQLNIDHQQKTKSIDPTLKQVVFGPHTKAKSISIHALKPSNYFDSHAKTNFISIPHTKTKVI